MTDSDKVFAGSIPAFYDTYLVPLIFEAYANDLAERAAARAPKTVLETAAGSGVVTRALAARLAANARYTVTDLNQPMLDHAANSAGYAEARRVLKPRGALLFNIWDQIDANEFADVVTEAAASVFPDDPPRFLARTPHGYHEMDLIREELGKAGRAVPLSGRDDRHPHRHRAEVVRRDALQAARIPVDTVDGEAAGRMARG
jgi:SAM-dependent methyltransferase